jgi:hypothetical protein
MFKYLSTPYYILIGISIFCSLIVGSITSIWLILTVDVIKLSTPESDPNEVAGRFLLNNSGQKRNLIYADTFE